MDVHRVEQRAELLGTDGAVRVCIEHGGKAVPNTILSTNTALTKEESVKKYVDEFD